MAGITDAGDFAGGAAPAAEAAMPLFDGPEAGPFGRSRVAPSPLERTVAGIIWLHRGRARPVALSTIAAVTGLDERKVKETVYELRVTHRCAIGARRGFPGGYFWMVDAEDAAVGLTPYRDQVVTGWRVLRALDDPARLRELHGQLRLEEGC